MTDRTDPDAWATWRELHAQPDIWRRWAATFDPKPLRDWVKAQAADEVWFTGAGTSAYIGDILAAGFEGSRKPRLRSVPSTDIVSRPRAFLAGRKPLVVSFGRSGNSSESIGVLDALDALAPDAPRLNITCNAGGALAMGGGAGASRVVLLPPETHDAGFAMTSSFSTMLLTAALIFDPTEPPATLASLATLLDRALPLYGTWARASALPARIVFVGAGPLGFAAREAALKVMELTAGQVPALWDTTLGFRHGPKSFVRDDTMIVVFTSPDAGARRYDDDLESELRAQFPQANLLSIDPTRIGATAHPRRGGLWAAPLYVAFAQVLGVEWSARLGLNVDDPFSGQGTLSRVVSGVRLHEVLP